jgi:microcystin-dependent protein
MAAVAGCGPAEDFQDMEQVEELAEALKLPVATVAVSSVQPSTNHVGANAVDGNAATRWSSAWSDPQWITLDLGASKAVNRVVLRWEGAYSRDFDLQISNDNTTFTTFRSVRGKGSSAVDDLAVTASGRYLRLYSLARGTAYGVSLWELEAHAADAPTTPSPTPVALPAKIQAEAPARFYDTTAANQGTTACSSTSLDAQGTTDAGGGCNVGWTAAGEWLEWDVSVATSGSFDIVARLAAGTTGKTLHFELDGARIGTTLTAPAAGWQAFSDVVTRGISIGAGSHKLRLVVDTGDLNINWFEVKTASTGTPPANKDACKRGVAYGGNSSADLTTLSNGLSWWYNWDQRPESGAASVNQGLGVEFVPMIWGESHIGRAQSTIPTGLRTLLGFNEPNFGSQANLTPDRAAELWPQIEQIAAAKGITKIASPAVNYCGGSCTDTNPINWLKRFYAACRTRYANGCKVDYTAYHSYVCQLNWLQDKIQELTNAHTDALANGDPADNNDFNKPIWLTEFACGDKPSSWPSITQQNQIDYVNAALPWLEGDSRIMRYAWFSGRTTAVPNANLLGSSGQLTALGRAYLAQPHNASCPLKPYTP